MEYRITIGSRSGGPGLPGRPRGKLEGLKAVLVGVLGLGILIGILLAAFVVGSVVASLLLVLLAMAFVVGMLRYLLKRLKRHHMQSR